MMKKQIRMFAPIEQNKCLEFFNNFKEGKGLFIDNPEHIAKAQGREVSRVKAAGKVLVTMNITQRNMERHGYVCTTNKQWS